MREDGSLTVGWLALSSDVLFSCGDELKDRLLVAHMSCQNLGPVKEGVREDHI